MLRGGYGGTGALENAKPQASHWQQRRIPYTNTVGDLWCTVGPFSDKWWRYDLVYATTFVSVAFGSPKG